MNRCRISYPLLTISLLLLSAQCWAQGNPFDTPKKKPGNPFEESQKKKSKGLPGRFVSENLSLEISAKAKPVGGYITYKGKETTFTGTIKENQLSGSFELDGATIGFKATLKGDDLTVSAGELQEVLKRQTVLGLAGKWHWSKSPSPKAAMH
jgi:hypothetical protein